MKRRYIKELEGYGWTFVDTPALNISFGLNNPPFGYGFNRRVDDQIIGQASTGAHFQAFRYRSSTSRDAGFVVTMRLERSLPEFYMFPKERSRELIQGVQLAAEPFIVVAEDEGYGRSILAAISGPAMAMAAANLPVDLGIDHDQLVALNAPRKPVELRAFVEALGHVHQALRGADIGQYVGEAPPAYLSFYKRPHWIYIPQDDTFLTQVNVTGGGQNHKAMDIVYSANFGLPFTSLTHTWETTHTRTDANGNVRTEVRHHSEAILEFRAPFQFRSLGVNRGSGERVKFESEAFNKAFKVRCRVPRFAYDVLHPRHMEYLLRTNPLPFEICDDGRVLVTVAHNDPGIIDMMSSFFFGFFGRVPDFTWKELGLWPRPIAEVERY